MLTGMKAPDSRKEEPAEPQEPVRIIIITTGAAGNAGGSAEDDKGVAGEPAGEPLRTYEIPEEYIRAGGRLPEAVQRRIFGMCGQYGIDSALILGMIEVESGYRPDARNGSFVGYMQVSERWHKDRMERLGVEDIMDPVGNVTVGTAYMAELLDKYDGDSEKALTAYRWGPTGAYRKYFSAGVDGCAYSRKVLEAAEAVRARMESAAGEG